MNAILTTIGFDADDTLWHNERFFRVTQERFARLLSDYSEPAHLADRLLAAEKRNLGRYGFGIKGFILSMIETAIEVTDERVPGSVVRELIEAGQEMLEHPIDLLPHARTAIEGLADEYRILLITKGDLLDQERKLAQSGLGELFDGVEVISHKTTEAYIEIFDRQGTGIKNAMMVGNSLRSDVNPVVDAGGWGVHVPHDLTWSMEHAPPPKAAPRFYQISDLGDLAMLVANLRKD